MAWGTLTIGPLVLKETDILDDVTNANTGERTVRVSGAETNPGNGTGNIEAKQQDIMSLMDRIMPVQFERKSSYNGYYRATDTNTTLEQWEQGPGQVRWALTLEFIGSDNALDLEGRLANVVRKNSFSLTGERWHAPDGGHYGYVTGAALSSITRQSTDGPLTVYRSIPAGVNPRWGTTVAGALLGRVRFLSGGIERLATRAPVPLAGWELNNGLVRVRPATAANTTLLVAFWDGTTWREKAWDIRFAVAADVLVPGTHFQSVVVTRLDAEAAVVRIVARYPSNTTRVIVDLTLRRGARFVEGYVQRATSGEIWLVLDTTEPSVSNVGYVVATAADANGQKFTAGTSVTFSGTPGGFMASSRTALDFYIGVENSGAPAGDTALSLRDQYIGAMAEKVGVVKR